MIHIKKISVSKWLLVGDVPQPSLVELLWTNDVEIVAASTFTTTVDWYHRQSCRHCIPWTIDVKSVAPSISTIVSDKHALRAKDSGTISNTNESQSCQ